MIDIISNNPYRLLGVFTTSPQKDIVANQGKMKAFLKVGKEVSFQLDLPHLLPSLSRNTESVSKAVSDLTLASEQLKYAQFWFASQTQFDEIAIGKLIEGDLVSAIDILNKRLNVSSLQNLIVCSLIQDDIVNAVHYAEILYSSHKEDFVRMVLGDNATISADHIAYEFLSVLCSNYSGNDVINALTNSDWMAHVKDLMINPLIENITSATELAKSTKGQSPDIRYSVGEKLMKDTKTSVDEIRQLGVNSDMRCQMVLDKLGTEILQCGIDYFNGSDSPTAAKKAMVLQNYALSVVVGKMAKDRCKENVETLKKIIENLPPQEVFEEDKAIREELRIFCKLPDRISHSVALLNKTKTHLESIKTKLGSTNSYYLKISTQVVGNALHNLIEEVNRLQNDQSFKLNLIIDKAKALSDLKSVLYSAWDAIKIMDSFDMEYEFRNNRYNSNRNTLQNMCQQVGISTNRTSNTSSNSGCMVVIAVLIVLGILVSCI